ncbi:MAG: sugar ABC transporter ATP-binding protein, partial [Propionibacteriaceae bacterium]
MTTVTLNHVSKSFGPVCVIDDVTLTLEPGQVHVLLGENGAGKSTLIKMMSGIYHPDKGEVLIDGKPVHLAGPRDAERRGIATIHQELNLVPTMSIAENIMLGRFPTKAGMIDRRAVRQRAQAALDRIGITLDIDLPVGKLGIAKQQLVEIARALSLESKVLILDEPTAALTGKEITQLFEIVEQLKNDGVAMAFISHHLDEIPRIGDTVSILRDGHFIDRVPATTPEPELVTKMVGRPIDQQFPARAATIGDELLRIDKLTSAGKFSDVSISVRAGEVVGLAGLVGAGRTEVIRAIAGADSYDSGSISVAGKTIARGKVAKAIEAGIGHIPEDRKGQGLVLGASINENL